MNLDAIAPCPQCALRSVRTVYLDGIEHLEEADLLEEDRLLLVWGYPDDPLRPDDWSIRCGCGYSQRSAEAGAELPSYRRRSPDMAREIERLRIESGKSTNTLKVKVIGSVAMRSGMTFYSWSDDDQSGGVSER